MLVMSLAGCGEALPQIITATQGIPGAFTQKFTYKISDITQVSETSQPLDILWVVDNSGSMDIYQQRLVDNMQAFMQQLARNKGLQWKMGLLSTDQNDAPYVGFGATPLDFLTLDAINLFRDAVNRLGTGGSGTERTFSPTISALRANSFLRSEAPLAYIMVTDAVEQSSMSASSFISELVALKGGDKSKVLPYAILGAADFGCSSRDSVWNYSSSKYKTVIDEFKGSAFPLCSDFAQSLTNLAASVVSRVSSVRITLQAKPQVETIQVWYRGELIADKRDEAVVWYYDGNDNSIRISDPSFLVDPSSELTLIFEKI